MFGDVLTADRPPGVLGGVVQLTDTLIRRFCAIVLWLTLLAMLLPTSLNAALRYLSDSSIVWSEQLVNCLFPWFVMAGAALAAQHSRHIGVELLPSLLARPVMRKLRMLVHLGIIAACAFVVWYGSEIAMLERNTSFTLIHVSQAWSYLALLAGYTLIGLTSLTGIYRLLQKDAPLTSASSSVA